MRRSLVVAMAFSGTPRNFLVVAASLALAISHEPNPNVSDACPVITPRAWRNIDSQS